MLDGHLMIESALVEYSLNELGHFVLFIHIRRLDPIGMRSQSKTGFDVLSQWGAGKNNHRQLRK